MITLNKHLVYQDTPIKSALVLLNELAQDAILFVVDSEQRLIGSLTDGDVRRGLINGVNIESAVVNIIQSEPKFIEKGDNDIKKVISYREGNFRILPILDKDRRIINIINFRKKRSYLPVDAVIMAGGRGQRLQPLTNSIPKPLLKVGNKPIIEHNIERLALYGIHDFWISLKYLGEQIETYLGNGEEKDIEIKYVWEDQALGTVGAVSKIEDFMHDYVLITNSDLLTNIDYEHFFLDFIAQDADLAIVTIPYQVNVPYAVLETDNFRVLSFKEKPTYTYYSNGGIYLMKREVLKYLPYNTFFNATDLMEKLIEDNLKVVSYPLIGYWLDVGKHEDFEKAQKDILQIKF